MNEHKGNASVIEIRQQHKAKTNSNNKLRLVFLLLRFSAPYLHLEKKEGKEEERKLSLSLVQKEKAHLVSLVSQKAPQWYSRRKPEEYQNTAT